ncbi:MAG TPA: DedA family protein [Rectinemataceae bacterium]|nr:DedA family protein [Rectinemataceae bacterium]
MSQILAFFGPLLAGHVILSIFIFLFLFGFTLPISEEIALALVGVFVRGTGTPIPETLLVAVCALALADFVYYGLARSVGPRFLRFKFFSRIVKPDAIVQGERYFHRRGPRIVFACRFVVGLRMPGILSAGFLRMPFRRFLAYDGLAILIGTPLWLGVGYAFGAQLDREVGLFGRLLAVIAPLAVIAGAVLVYKSVRADRARADAEEFDESGSRDCT